MKKLFFIVLLVFAGGVLFNSCEKTTMDTNDYSSIVKPETKLKEEESSDLSDENIWVLNYLYESLVDQKEEFLLDFLNCQGAPEWSGAILKRGEQISIATVPTSKNNCITGVFKIYQPIDQDPIINYYSIKEIDAIMERNIELNDFEYIGVRGAIQGFILSSQKLGFPIDQEKIDWLRNNNREPDFRVRFFCLEEWDCSDGEVSTDTHWVDCDGDGYFESCCEGTEFVCCELVSIECWVEEIPRNFPSSGIGTSCGCEGDGVESDNDGTHGDGQNSYDAKSDVLTSWMSSLNIENDLFNLLYDCVYYLPAPFGGAESGVNLNCAKSVLMGQLAENLTESQLELINDPENSDLSDAISQFLIDDNGMSQEEKVELINNLLTLDEIIGIGAEGIEWLIEGGIGDISIETKSVLIGLITNELGLTSDEALILEAETSGKLLYTMAVVMIANSEMNNEDEDPPGCDGCSVAEAQVVYSDHIRAREMLECAINKLEDYDPNQSNGINIALVIHFGDHSEVFADMMTLLLKYVNFFAGGCEYQAQNTSEGLCSTAFAWSYPVIQLTSVKLCRPTYWNQTDTERSTTLIHEWMHLYFLAGDIAYDFETTEYSNLTFLQSIFNADSFANFIEDICP